MDPVRIAPLGIILICILGISGCSDQSALEPATLATRNEDISYYSKFNGASQDVFIRVIPRDTHLERSYYLFTVDGEGGIPYRGIKSLNMSGNKLEVTFYDGNIRSISIDK